MKYLSFKSLIDETLEPVRLLHSDNRLPDQEGIHDLRVSIKRLLARMQLIEELSGTSSSKRKITRDLKLISRYLSIQRDHDVLVALIDDVIKKNNTENVKLLLTESRKLISKNALKNSLELNDLKKMGFNIVEDCRELESCLEQEEKNILKKDIRAYVKKGFAKVCAQGVQVLKGDDLEKLHKWRKKIKFLYYQNEVLHESLHQSLHKPLHKASHKTGKKSLIPDELCEKLGSKLGEIHDIYVLKNILNQQTKDSKECINQQAFDSVCGILEGRIERLLNKCRHLHRDACEHRL